MEIELPGFIKADLWRNYLIGLYQKYWLELKNLPEFKFESLIFFLGELEKMASKAFPDNEARHIPSNPSARAFKKLEKDINSLKKEIADIDIKFDLVSDSERAQEISEFKVIARILERIRLELNSLNVLITTCSNNEIDFIEAETKIVLKTNKEEPKS